MKYIAVVLFVVLGCITHAAAEIRITEIAWMGNGKSQYGEWFELYNDGSSSVNLAGWKLYEGSSTVSYSFSKSIPAQSYLVVERVTPSVPDPLPGISGEAGSFGGSGFANTGEHLVLKDAAGTIIHELDFSGGWPGGDAKEYKTMQWNGSKWITATPTPGAAAPTDGDTGDPVEDEALLEEVEEHSIPLVSPNDPYIEILVPSQVVRGVPYVFTGNVMLEYSFRVNRGVFYWNMGDGTVVKHTDQLPVRHVYDHAGTYVLSLAYYSTEHDAVPLLVSSKKVVVTEPSIVLAAVGTSGFSLENKSNKQLDLSGWRIATPTTESFLPHMSIVGEGARIVIPYSRIVQGVPTFTRLFDPSGALIATTEKPQALPAARSVSVQHVLSEEVVALPENPDESVVVESADERTPSPETQNHTKTIVIGVGIVFVIGLCLLLERFMARQE